MSAEGIARLENDLRVARERWAGLGWQLLPEEPMSPAQNVALDSVLLKRVGDETRPPTLRFWSWDASAVIIGRFQSVQNEVDLDEATARGVTIVRRTSGGGAMFVQPEATITYSLYLPERHVEGLSYADSYAALDSWVVAGLRDLGVDAWYVPLNDITSAEGKIGGAAQARRNRAVLHHTTVSYEMNPDEMVRVLRIGREKLSDKGIASAAKRVSPLRRQTDLPRAAIRDHLVATFRATFGLADTTLTPDERAETDHLVQTQFATDTWTHDLP
jgi:lipoate---protein ligase